MMTARISFVLLLFLSGLSWQRASAQQSDFAVKKGFEEQVKLLSGKIESASTIGALDSLKSQIDALEIQFMDQSAFLDKALYPETFAEKLKNLRSMQSVSYDKVYLIQTQGVRIDELEMKLLYLTNKLDTLSAQRERLYSDLRSSQKTASELRETVKRLQANMQAKDKLIFALVDSIFLPYGKEMSQMADVQQEAISRKLEKANVVGRVEEIANDNVKFLSVTQLQAKDFANLVDQYQHFSNRWLGLRDKMNAVLSAGVTRPAAPASGTPQAGPQEIARTEMPGARIDSSLLVWGSRLQTLFWGGLAKEFSDKNLQVHAFNDAPSFAASVRAHVAEIKATGTDPSVFVNEVWKGRIDREWRDALIKDGMLGKTEYAALDKEISELSQEKIDLKFIIYSAVVVLLVLAAWWFFIRKPRPEAEPLAAKAEEKK